MAWHNNGEVVVVDDHDEATAVSDECALEHLKLMSGRTNCHLKHLTNYGSLFIGEENTVAYGDKGGGTNHTLPIGKAAHCTGGLWAGKFIETITYPKADASGKPPHRAGDGSPSPHRGDVGARAHRDRNAE
jgi:sulfopropanediol 3-dehydrogenase